MYPNPYTQSNCTKTIHTMAYVLSKVLSTHICGQIQDYADSEQKMNSKQECTKSMY